MRKIIKIIDEENIEISRYVSPEARFFNPCTDIHNDYDKYESYCDFKEVINPFKMYAENQILHSIIKEALILTENSRFDNMYAYDDVLLPILNKLRESGIRNYIKVEGSEK